MPPKLKNVNFKRNNPPAQNNPPAHPPYGTTEYMDWLRSLRKKKTPGAPKKTRVSAIKKFRILGGQILDKLKNLTVKEIRHIHNAPWWRGKDELLNQEITEMVEQDRLTNNLYKRKGSRRFNERKARSYLHKYRYNPNKKKFKEYEDFYQ